jgi:recombinational DNA repair ATPase RecF
MAKTIEQLEQDYFKAVARWRAVMNNRNASIEQYFRAEAKKEAALVAWNDAKAAK